MWGDSLYNEGRDVVEKNVGILNIETYDNDYMERCLDENISDKIFM